MTILMRFAQVFTSILLQIPSRAEARNIHKKHPGKPGRFFTYACLLPNSSIIFRAATGITVPGPKMAEAPWL
uniref:Uncharacterized protein n=1 Tax=Candidatus Kentrum sp. FW TaxID=2126338 RepID=A0A450T3M0_9GAMM|nr:MAG: hypothetical protein BECKFW1821A_GA0114235_11117 [Candidatus Kentron sp. FW]